MTYSLNECAEIWEESGRHGIPEERIQRASAWLDYYRFCASQVSTEETPEHWTTDILLRGGLLRHGDTVLDIGAGTGDAALSMAGYCRAVTALDLSGASLDVLMSRARTNGISNVKTVASAWESFRTDEKFDLVFSSMCPCICGIDELRRMEGMSRRACCIVTVGKGSTDKHRSEMMRRLDIHPKGGMLTEALHYYNALYLMGRQVNVTCQTTHYDSLIPAEQVIEQYSVYFKIFGVPKDVSVPFLEGYLKENTENGLLREISHINYVMLYWRI